MGNVHAFAHRVTAISVACLSTAGFVFCSLGGFSCNYIKITPLPGQMLMTPDGMELAGDSTPYFIGVRCDDSPFFTESDLMWKRSQLFLYISLALGVLTTVLAWTLGSWLPPTHWTWRTISILSAAAAVLEVPIFLLFESEPCTLDPTRQKCSVAAGGYLNIISIGLFVVMTLWTQFVPPPNWKKELQAWHNNNHSGAGIDRVEVKDVKINEISIPSGGDSRDSGEGTEDMTAPRDSPRAASPPPRPPAYWNVQRKERGNDVSIPVVTLPPTSMEKQQQQPPFRNFQESPPRRLKIPTGVPSSNDEEANQEPSVEQSYEEPLPRPAVARSPWPSLFASRLSSHASRDEDTLSHVIDVKGIARSVVPHVNQNHVVVHDLEADSLAPSEHVAQQQQRRLFSAFGTGRNSKQSESSNTQSLRARTQCDENAAAEEDEGQEETAAASSPAYQTSSMPPIHGPGDERNHDGILLDVVFPLAAGPIVNRETSLLQDDDEEDDDENDEMNEMKDHPKQVRKAGTAVVLASLKGKAQELKQRLSLTTTKPKANKGIKVTIICPDGREEKKQINTPGERDLSSPKPFDEVADHPEPSVGMDPPEPQSVARNRSQPQTRVDRKLSDKKSSQDMTARDFVLTHSIPRKSASYTQDYYEQGDTAESPIRGEWSGRQQREELPLESLTMNLTSQMISNDDVMSEMTFGPSDTMTTEMPLPSQDTMAILEDLARLEQ